MYCFFLSKNCHFQQNFEDILVFYKEIIVVLFYYGIKVFIQVLKTAFKMIIIIKKLYRELTNATIE